VTDTRDDAYDYPWGTAPKTPIVAQHVVDSLFEHYCTRFSHVRIFGYQCACKTCRSTGRRCSLSILGFGRASIIAWRGDDRDTPYEEWIARNREEAKRIVLDFIDGREATLVLRALREGA
jgi:hypothetical protein